jgi:phospholipid/cholesterol/gamma-HCH transport system substrate-binding protein
METRANYALIGLFTLAVILCGFLFAFWFSTTGQRTERKQYQVQFIGSVSGLSNGAYVLFNGLKVGDVKELGLLPNDPSRVYARIDIDAGTPVTRDTKAKLEIGGLTGVASIALEGGQSTAEPLPSGGIIVAAPSQFQDLLKMVQDLSQKADSFIDRANKLIDDNSANITASISHIESATAVLGDRNGNFQQTLAKIDPDKVRSILDNADQSVAKFNAMLSGPESKTLIADFSETVKSIKKLSDNLTRFSNTGLRQYEGLAIDGRRTLENVDRAVRQLEKNPQSVIFGAKPALPAFEGR